jgi:hypothetical protein
MFEVELASGKINIYHISQLLAVVYEVLDIQRTTPLSLRRRASP